eukprot:TRINITY_DN11084_c0_g1_i14.p1 TRINITY_DN11084_c0_g1~~TRINITY_DN11084_c0_g1_i14.p1  ORF type:complete len:207 (+),score=-31.84 TRINITY_DN11084_c0_g1_i14:374-994(+)
MNTIEKMIVKNKSIFQTYQQQLILQSTDWQNLSCQQNYLKLQHLSQANQIYIMVIILLQHTFIDKIVPKKIQLIYIYISQYVYIENVYINIGIDIYILVQQNHYYSDINWYYTVYFSTVYIYTLIGTVYIYIQFNQYILVLVGKIQFCQQNYFKLQHFSQTNKIYIMEIILLQHTFQKKNENLNVTQRVFLQCKNCLKIICTHTNI